MRPKVGHWDSGVEDIEKEILAACEGVAAASEAVGAEAALLLAPGCSGCSEGAAPPDIVQPVLPAVSG